MIFELQRRWACRRLGQASIDPRLAHYARRSFAPRRSTPLEKVRFVVFDTEATGLDMTSNRMLSLAAVAINNGVIDLSDRFEVMLQADHVGGAEAAEIHQMVTADVRHGQPEDEGVLAFLTYLETAVLVAHHAGFDVAMLNKVLARLGPVRVYNAVVDTLSLHRRLTRGPLPRDDHHRDTDRSLDGLCTKFGFEIPMRHTAAGDALATAHVLLALLRTADRRGIRTLGALLRS